MLERLDLVETGELDFDGGHALSCVELPSGWTVVLSEGLDFADGKRLEALSARNRTLGARLWDGPLISEAWGYDAGRRTWSVQYDPENGLTAQGAPPATFDAIREASVRLQDEDASAQVDYVFDVPLELSDAVCGFRADAALFPPATIVRVVEPRKAGRAAIRQAETRALNAQLEARVRAEIFPAAEALGFESVMVRHDAGELFPNGATGAFVRRRGGDSEHLWFRWRLGRLGPQFWIDFSVQRGSRISLQRSGRAHRPLPPLTLKERFMGRNHGANSIEQGVADGRELLLSLERHLVHGETHPHIRPAEFRD